MEPPRESQQFPDQQRLGWESSTGLTRCSKSSTTPTIGGKERNTSATITAGTGHAAAWPNINDCMILFSLEWAHIPLAGAAHRTRIPSYASASPTPSPRPAALGHPTVRRNRRALLARMSPTSSPASPTSSGSLSSGAGRRAAAAWRRRGLQRPTSRAAQPPTSCEA